jgi:phosphoglucomutase
MKLSPFARKPAGRSVLGDVSKFNTVYDAEVPDATAPGQRVAFGSSGHPGSSLSRAFNARHILAVCQPICLYRKEAGIDRALFKGVRQNARLLEVIGLTVQSAIA